MTKSTRLLEALKSCPFNGGQAFNDWYNNVRQPLLNELDPAEAKADADRKVWAAQFKPLTKESNDPNRASRLNADR